MRNTFRQLLIVGLTLTGVAAGAYAQPRATVPDRMEPVTPKFKRDTENVGITEHLGARVPLDLPFTDSTGRSVKLADYFKQGRPVILQLGYFNCPMLCDVVSKGLMDGVRALPLEPGRDYDLLYVSVNPEERWDLGQAKKRTYVEEFGRAGAAAGWNFLVGPASSSRAVADAVGFGFKKVEGRDDYSHPPMIVVLTADGTVSRYLYGFQYPSETLKLGLTEAGQGKVGSYVEQIVVALCYHYDEYAGKYSLSYMRLMQAGAIITALCVGTWLGSRYIRDARAARRLPPLTQG
ncbi:MAG TPA: SCO family protein [Tepidisphaeraceae bacterium]|jgi:protein SCO1/2